MSQGSNSGNLAVPGQDGISSTDQKARDMLWYIVVGSLAFVVVGTFMGLAIGVLFMGKSVADGLQLLLTMFTMAVAFLGGLFTPSPAQHKANNQ